MKKFLCLLAVFLLPAIALADLEAHFLDVGHGDCTIIICDGEAMIIDGGDTGESDKVFSAIQQLGITTLKYAVATHPQADHIGGLPAAFHAATVRALYTPVTEYDINRFAILMDKAAEMSVPVIVPKAGDTLHLGDAVLTVISPTQEYRDPNDMSIILRIDYGETSFLLCGDAGKDVERDLIEIGADLNVDVLKVAHHGGEDATTDEFLGKVTPRYAVISCSERYANPDPDLIARIIDRNTTLIRTDRNGDIVIMSDGKHLHAEAEKYFIGNANTSAAHSPKCRYVQIMNPENQTLVFTAEQGESRGYHPCKHCSPWKPLNN